MSLSRIAFATFYGVGALTQSGCGFASSPADNLRFQPPPGWHASPGIMGFMQFWRPPSNDREVLMLFKSPKPVTANDVFSPENMRDTMHDVTITQRSAIQICDNQPATYIQGRGQSRRGDENVEVVITTTRATTYFALYARPIGAPPNPMAEAALRELCAKP